MISSFIHCKVYLFIDVSNVFYSQRTLGWRIAYAKLMRYLKRECGEEVKCFAYAAVDENHLAERKFLDMLDIHGYILRTKALKEIKTSDGNKHKGSLDIELAFEMVELAEKI